MACLVEEYRGNVLENIHRGRICVVNDCGQVVGSCGDPQAITFFRSASKPLQALPVLARDLHKHYNLTDDEITIMAGSHAGEPMHLAVILSMLEKAGFLEEDLIMLPAWPASPAAKEQLIREGKGPRKALHNCSGKHVGAMMLAKALGGSHKDYWKPESPAQVEIRRVMGALCSYPAENIEIGIDGCGVPVFAVPMKGIATGYLRLAHSELIEEPALGAAAACMVPRIHTNNLMMRGTGYLCSRINEDENITAKGGACGVYGFALKKERLGVAIKIEDGTEDVWPIVIAEILRQLGYKNQKTFELLASLAPATILNNNKTTVGSKKTVFKLA